MWFFGALGEAEGGVPGRFVGDGELELAFLVARRR